MFQIMAILVRDVLQIKSHKLSVKSFVTRLGISTNKEDLDVKQGKMSEQ